MRKTPEYRHLLPTHQRSNEDVWKRLLKKVEFTVELSSFSRLAIKIAGLFMIVISLDDLPSNFFRLMGPHDPTRGLLAGSLFVPALISITIGALLVFKGDVVVDRAFRPNTEKSVPLADATSAFAETAIFLLGIYILVNSTSGLGYYLFNYYFAYFQNKGAAAYPYAQANPLDFGVLFTFAIRFLVGFALILGAKNLSRLHQRIRTYRPMKDLRDS